MKRIVSIVAALVMVFAFAATNVAAKVTGEVVKFDKETIAVKDKKGKVHEFKIDAATQKRGTIKEGRTADVEADDNGHATIIADSEEFNDFLTDFMHMKSFQK